MKYLFQKYFKSQKHIIVQKIFLNSNRIFSNTNIFPKILKQIVITETIINIKNNIYFKNIRIFKPKHLLQHVIKFQKQVFQIRQILGFTDPLEIFQFHAKILTQQKQYKLRDTAYVSKSAISLT